MEQKPERIIITDRSLEKYLRFLNLTIRDLRNKKILDLGSGRFQRFGRELLEYLRKKDSYENAEIVALDITLAKNERIKEIKEKEAELFKSEKLGLVAANFLKLPFKDESFDMVLSLFGTPFYLESEEDIKQSIKEILRVLKPQGEARIYPSDDNFEKILKELSEENKNFSYESIEEKKYDVFWLDLIKEILQAVVREELSIFYRKPVNFRLVIIKKKEKEEINKEKEENIN